MTQPRNFYDALKEWQETVAEIERLKPREKELRLQLFAATFPQPNEGVNNYKLPTGQTFAGTHKVTRSIQPEQISVVRDLLPLSGSNSTVDDFLRVKYELNTDAYKRAPAETRAILDRMIISKPATPSIEIKEKASGGKN